MILGGTTGAPVSRTQEPTRSGQQTDQAGSPGTRKEACGGQKGTETSKEGAWAQLAAPIPHPAGLPPYLPQPPVPAGIPAFLMCQRGRGSRHALSHTGRTAHSSPTPPCHHEPLRTPTHGLVTALRAESLPPSPRPGHASRCKRPVPRITASGSGTLRRGQKRRAPGPRPASPGPEPGLDSAPGKRVRGLQDAAPGRLPCSRPRARAGQDGRPGAARGAEDTDS